MEKENLKPYHSSVQTQFHLRGNRFKRMTWHVGVLGGLVAIAWIAWSTVSGHSEIFEGGPISSVHRTIERDCRACHANWSILHRLVQLDERVSSIDESTCIACHSQDAHPHVIPGKRILAFESEDFLVPYSHSTEPACGTCHTEHTGTDNLLDVTDRMCTDCHRTIRSFEDGHPEFAMNRLLGSDGKAGPDDLETIGIGPQHGVRAVLEHVGDTGAGTGWQGRGQIRFNHDLHLNADGIMGPNGRLRLLSNDCSACHEAESDGILIQPVNYQRHCAECHPLVFDPERIQEVDEARFGGEVLRIAGSELINESGGENRSLRELREFPERFRPLVVPHEELNIVRGFLTDFYRLQERTRTDEDVPPSSPGGAPAVLRTTNEEAVRTEVERQTELLSSRPHWVLETPQFEFLVADRRTGCFYCHVQDEQQPVVGAGLPNRRNTDIPAQWLKHGRFAHKPHDRLMQCEACHQLDETSTDDPVPRYGSLTSDVLMPSVKVCRECHASTLDGKNSSVGFDRHIAGQRCVQCHDYHATFTRHAQ